MDKYTSAVIAFLEKHKAVRGVRFVPHDPCSLGDISAWHTKNAPHKLPADLQAFLFVSNGFTLQWDGVVQRQSIRVGSMCLNGVKSIQRIDMDHWPSDDSDNALVIGMGKTKSTKSKIVPSKIKTPELSLADVEAAFDLDSTCNSGRVALLYTSAKAEPEVWFQDLGCSWNFLASSFSDYFRLMLSHVGLPNWQYAFTPIGLEPATRAWLRLLAPGRLAIDNLPNNGVASRRKASAGSKGRSGGKTVPPDHSRDMSGSEAEPSKRVDPPPRSAKERPSSATPQSRTSHGSLAWKRS